MSTPFLWWWSSLSNIFALHENQQPTTTNIILHNTTQQKNTDNICNACHAPAEYVLCGKQVHENQFWLAYSFGVPSILCITLSTINKTRMNVISFQCDRELGLFWLLTEWQFQLKNWNAQGLLGWTRLSSGNFSLNSSS